MIQNQLTEKKLLLTPPPITSYPLFANLLGVILNNEAAYSWYYNYFIQLYGAIGSDGLPLYFNGVDLWEKCPFVDMQKIHRDYVEQNWDSVTDFLIDSLNSGYYSYYSANRFYIKVFDKYHQQHDKHQTFIYGYDLEKKEFSIADFYKDYSYTLATASFEEVEDSYNNIHLSDMIDWNYGYIWQIKPKNTDYQFDMELLKILLEDYLHSKNSVDSYEEHTKRKKGGIVYGVANYDLIVSFIDLVLQEKQMPDIRPLHVMFDHKSIMVERIKFLDENGYLMESEASLSAYGELKNDFLKIRNRIIKSFYTNTFIEAIKASREKLLEIKNKECRALENLIHSLKNTSSNT